MRSVILTVAVLSFTAGVAQADLVAYWDMEDGSGSVASDVSGYGTAVDGVFAEEWTGYGPLPVWTTGKFGGGILLGKDDDTGGGEGTGWYNWNYLYVAYDPLLDLSTTWTLATWLRTSRV